MSLYSVRFRVSWSDVDNSKTLHFTKYLEYCENVEVELLNNLDIDINNILSKEAISLPRVYVECRYWNPVRFNQWVRVDVDEFNISEYGYEIKYKIWNENDGVLAAECTIKTKSMDLKSLKEKPLPEVFLNRLRAYIDKLKGGRIQESRMLVRNALDMAYKVYIETEGRLGDSWRDKSWSEVLDHLKSEIREIEETVKPHERIHDCLDACALSAILAAKAILEYKEER